MNKPDSKTKTPTPPPATEGLTPLDQDRASSVADEGGASAATVEAQEAPDESTSAQANRRARAARERIEHGHL